MSFHQFLERQRIKSEEQRRRSAFWAAGGFTLLLALVWFAQVEYVFKGKDQLAQVASSQATSSVKFGGVIEGSRTRIIEGWKVITKNE